MSSTIEKKGGSKSGTTREELLQQLRARRSMLQSQLHAHETDDDDHHHHHHHHHRSASTSISNSNINVHDTSQHQAILSDTTLSLEFRSRSYSQIEQLPEMVKRAVSATDATSGRTPPQKGQNEVGTENDSMEAHQVVVTPTGTNSTTTTTKKAPPPQLTFVSSQSSVDLSHDYMSSSAPSTAQTTPLGLNTSTTRTRIRQGVFAVIRAGSCVTLQSLLQNGKCRVNERDYQNCTPLHIAAHEGREDMAVILLAFGADVFAIDDRNRTPRDVAVSNRHSGLGRFLLLKMKEAALNQPVSPPKKPAVVTAGSATTTAAAYVKSEEEGDEAVLAPPPVMHRSGHITKQLPPADHHLNNPLTPLIPSTTIATSEFNTTSSATRRHRRKSSDPTRSLLDLDPSEGGRERLLAKLVAEADLEEAAAKLEKSERQRREQEEEDEKVRIDKEEEEAALNRHPSSHHMRTITPENASMFATTPTAALGNNNNNSVDPSQPLFGVVSALCNTCRPGWGHLSAVSPTLGFSMSPAGKSQMLLDTNNNTPPTTAIITTSPENHYHHQYTASGSALPSSICPNCFAHHVAVPSSSGGGVGMAQFSMTSHSASSSTTLDQQQQQHRRNISTASDDVEALQTRPRTTSMIGGSSQHNITTYPPLPITQHPSSPSATYLKYYQNSVFRTITDEQSLIICLVGLPGRGKSFISKRISRYLNWKGIPCRVFNAGDYRRRMLGVEGTNGADFFDPSNEKAKEARDQMAHMAVEDMLKFISRNPVPAVGILDATNTTVVRRKLLLDTFRDYFELPSSASGTNVNIPTSSSSSGGGGCPPRRMDKARVIFIESVCNVQDIITENILRAKFGNDDFKGVQDPQAVVAEFRDRIKQYEKVYETIHEEEDEGRISFIKIVDVKQRIILHHVRRGLASKVSYFLMNLHPMAFPVFIVVPGETTGTAAGKFGGDENLTAAGKEFARKMRRFIKERVVVMMEATNSNKNTPPTTTSSTITGGGSSNANTTTAQSEQSSFKKRTTTSSSSSSSSMGLRILCATNPSAQETLRIATRVTPKTKLVWGRDRLHVDPASSTTKHHHHHHHHTNTNNNNSPTTTEKPSTTSTVSSSSSSDEDGSLDASESSSSMDSLGCEDHDNVDALIKPHSSSKATTLLSTNNQSAASSSPPPPQSNSNHHASVPVSTPPSRLQKQSDLIQGVAVKSLRVLDDLNYGLVSNMSEAQISERYPKLSHQLFVDNITTGDNTGDESKNKSNATTPATTAAPSLSTSASAALPPSTTAGGVAGAKKILNYAVSFPRGESCRMCNVRLEGALFEIMRSNGPVMVIAPKVPSQGVLAFLTDVLPEKSPQLELPKHSIIEVTTKGQVVIHNLA